MPLFRSPSSTEFTDPMDRVTTDDPYILTLVSLTDDGVSNYWKGDLDDPDAEHSLKWIWQIHSYENDAPLLGSDGTVHEYWDWTSDKTGKGQRVARARQYIEALLGRTVEDDEISSLSLPDLLGKRVRAFFCEREGTDRSGAAVTRKKILNVSPYKPRVRGAAEVAAVDTTDVVLPWDAPAPSADAPAATPAAARPPAPAVAETKEQRRARLLAALDLEDAA